MAGQIDALPMNILKGLPANLKTRLDVWEVFGQDGYGAQQGGLGDGEFELTSVVYVANATDAETHRQACEDLQGTVVTVVDARGKSFDNCLVVKVTPMILPVIRNNQAGAQRVEVQWMFLRV